MLRISAQGARRLAIASTSASRLNNGSRQLAARHFTTNPAEPATKPETKPATITTTRTSAATTEKSGVRPPGVTFSNEPKPAKKKKGHKVRNTLVLAVLASAGFVGAAVYAMEDREFRRQFEHYVPGARSFMQLIKHHNNSVMMALSDVGYSMYDQSVYTGRFIYQQFSSLVNMLRHNSWHAPDNDDKATPSKPVVQPITSDKGDRRKDNGSISIPAAPLDKVQVAVDIPPLESESEAVVALSKALADVVSALNQRGLAPENVQQLKVLSDSIVALDKHLALLKDEERTAVEAALAEERSKFEATLTDVQEAAHLALKTREAELIETRDQLLRTAADAADERLAQELTAQRDLLERRYNRFVRARVDEERGRRLAQLDFVEAQLHELTQMAEQSGDLIQQSRAVSRLSVAIAAFKNAIAATGSQQPFASELSALISASANFPATNAAASSISQALAEQGVLSLVELEDRFENVRKEIRSVSLVPENGNFGSQVLSATLSKIMFEKEGLVEGNDVESVLARSSFYLKKHDLDSATRELNQLKGWPRQLAKDWIGAARARLEIEQAISVAEAEEQLAKITFL
ncbi:Glucose-6-phosphate 1-dehydrogenase [Coemansia brasiliensis]|uniref:MICOS complex subunit MIC60 n=1 Tax=Coemansia brasiliensis TaxID=2650707 RepID=A0A9W8I612_9FUNG|nr:Glucose-6-phosphate 1-dehydrogenase [Coemansia brasiliensis]